jgi:hypothetical protein
MSLSFNSISIFRDSLNNLCRKERYGYQSCKKDVCDLLKEYSFEDIRDMNFRLRDLDSIRLIKLRVQNSFQNLSKSDGFRLIICCNKKYETVTFLNIYPKRGKLAQIDQSKEEYKSQLRNYFSEFKNDELVQHNIYKNLDELK